MSAQPATDIGVDRPNESETYDLVIVGAGFAGLYMLHKARELNLRVCVIEAGADVGGTWYWNRYPGLRCDIESVQYSYSFSEEIQQEWNWLERFSPQRDILRYLNYVADKLDLRRDIRFGTRVEALTWCPREEAWTARTSAAPSVTAKFCVLATGALSSVLLPNIPGAAEFAGESYHTGAWPESGVHFYGKRVGVIGTGSSGVQIIPEIAKTAKSLHVFQRTAAYVLPARNRALEPEDARKWKDEYPARRERARNEGSGILYDGRRSWSVWDASEEERLSEFERCWSDGGGEIVGLFKDTLSSLEANEKVADFIKARIAEIVKDGELIRKLTPNFPVGAKRAALGTNYYETYTLPNVSLVDLKTDPISRILPNAVETASGTIPLDMLIFATGYDAVTGSVDRIDIRGRDGRALKKEWAAGPRAYLGLMTEGFPNLFMINGPGSPSVLSNMVLSIEQHVDWIGDCIKYLKKHELQLIEPEREAQEDWAAHVNEVSVATVFPTVDSWYVGANVPGKVRAFIPYCGGVGKYRQITADVATSGYRGFQFNSSGKSS